VNDMKKLFTFLSFWLVLLSCNKGVDPPPPPPERTPRDWTWTRDTLGDGTYQILPRGIWGSSPEDVYVVGHASPLFTGKIWHFNGSGWEDITPVYVEAFPGQVIYPFSATNVFGFGKDDVWIVGSRDTSSTPQVNKEGFIMRYDGQSWTGMTIPGAAGLLCVFGRSPSDVWVGGFHGKLHRFDGTSWTEHVLSDTTIGVQLFAGEIDSRLYAQGFTIKNAYEYYSLLEWDGVRWRIAEEVFGVGKNFTTLSLIEGELYTVVSSSVRKRVGENSWQELFLEPSATFHRVSGVSGTNLFAFGYSEVLYHFNGENWLRFTDFSSPHIGYYGAWIVAMSAFILGDDGGTFAYVLRAR